MTVKRKKRLPVALIGASVALLTLSRLHYTQIACLNNWPHD